MSFGLVAAYASVALGALAMGPGAAMLITVGGIFFFLILLERFVNGRRRRRDAARLSSGQETAAQQEARKEASARPGLWGMLFGPPAGQDPAENPMNDLHPDELEGRDSLEDLHPDELEGNFDGDPPPQGG